MVEDTIERINEIEDICGIERHFEVSSFTCQVKSLNDVFCAATKLRTDWNIGNAAITNVINILETNGIIVVEVEASDAFHCFIFQKIWMKRRKNNTAIYLPMKC